MESLGGKNLIKKLKLGLAGLVLAGFNSFNSANAQENYQSKYNTTTHYIIKEIQKENAFTSSKTLDKIIDKSKEITKIYFKGDNYNEEQVKNLLKKYSTIIENNTQSLDKKILDENSCYIKSLIYLAIGEENNLPLYPVFIPEHMYIRWDPNGKHEYDPSKENILNKGDVNWDARDSEFISDFDYQTLLALGKNTFMDLETLEKGIYFKSLNKKELLAIAYWHEGENFRRKKLCNKALEYANKAIQLNLNDPYSYNLKGSCLTILGLENKDSTYYENAIKSYKKALNLESTIKNEISAKIGVNYFRLKQTDLAIEYITKAIDITKQTINIPEMITKWDYLYYPYLKQRFIMYIATNQKEKAETDLETLKKIADVVEPPKLKNN